MENNIYRTREDYIKLAQDLYNQNISISTEYMIVHYGRFLYYRKIIKEFGSLNNWLRASGLPTIKHLPDAYTVEELKEILLNIYNKYGKVTTKTLKTEYGITLPMIKKIFGKNSMEEILVSINIPIKQGQRKMISKEDTIKEIIRIKNEFGYFSKPLMEKYGKINTKVVQRIWGSFSKMYEELGIERHPSGIIASDEEVIEDIKRVYNQFGTINYFLLDNEGKYSLFVYKTRFKGIDNIRKIVGEINPKSGGSVEAKYTINKYAKYLNDTPIYEKTFNWLKNPKTNANLKIDGFFPKYNIGIEYNGPQHYQTMDYYHQDEEQLEYRKYLDQLKIDLCKEHGIKIITVNYFDKLTENYINSSINKVLLATRTA